VIKTNIRQEEINIIKEHKKKANNDLIRDRCHALVLSNKEYNATQIADILDRDRGTIESWLNNFNIYNISSIFTNYDNNTNASKLSKEQIESIKEELQKEEINILWDISKLKEYINAKYSVIYESDTSYYHLFEISNYSFKLPEGFNKARNEKLVETRMLEIKEEIEKYKDEYEILFADECSLHFETEFRKMWLPKGKKTIFKVNKSLERQNYFGAWNIFTKQEHLIELTWQNTETIIKALEELQNIYKDKKLLIVWDNAGWHRSKELKSHLGKDNKFENIKLLWLPPYAPDKNPQEHIWKFAKDKTKNSIPDKFQDLKDIFYNSIQNVSFDYVGI
jgi:transposase